VKNRKKLFLLGYIRPYDLKWNDNFCGWQGYVQYPKESDQTTKWQIIYLPECTGERTVTAAVKRAVIPVSEAAQENDVGSIGPTGFRGPTAARSGVS
jgi:hypothetical protein